MIDADGLLVVRPQESSSYGMNTGVLADWSVGHGFPPWYEWRSLIKLVSIEEGVIARTCQGMFEGCFLLSSVDLKNLSIPNVTDMSYMFRGCSSLTAVNLTGIDTSSVRYMHGMFTDCPSLKTIYVLNLFTTTNVEHSEDMFYGCSALVGELGTEYDGSCLDKSRARIDGGLNEPGYFTKKNTTTNWTQLGTCEWLIDDDGLLTVRPQNGGETGSLSSWRSEEGPWYYQRLSIKSAVVEPGVFASECQSMFYGCNLLTSVDISNLDITDVTDMSFMFVHCALLQSIKMPTQKPISVNSVNYMFDGCLSLKTIDLSGFNTASATDMRCMFYGCTSLETVYVSKMFTTQSVEYSEDMFYGCPALMGESGTEYDINFINESRARIDGGSSKPGYFTEKAANLGWRLSGTCEWSVDGDGLLTVRPQSGRETGILANWEDPHRTSCSPWNEWASLIKRAVFEPGVTTQTCYNMFHGCNKLVTVDLSNLSIPPETSMVGMFFGCSSLISVDLADISVSSVASTMMMFADCLSLSSLTLPAGFNLYASNVRQGLWEDTAGNIYILLTMTWQQLMPLEKRALKHIQKKCLPPGGPS